MSPNRLPLLVTALALVAAACGGSSDPESAERSPDPVPAATTTAPTAAPTTVAPTGAASSAATQPVPVPPALAWKACGGGFQCTTLKVPLDYAKPADGNVSLRLIRIRATNPSRRIGSLLVNPGGPGVSAVDFLRGFATGSAPAALRRQFDLVAFDPRGTTGTAPVDCLGTAGLDTFFHVDQDPDTAAEVKTFDEQSQAFANGCAKRSGRILRHLSTADAAKDMDSVRAALREPKLNYLGYSYGTAIGAAYLDQFPTKVRAMVLDGALDPSADWEELAIGQGKGFDLALRSFFAWCDKTPDKCEFRKVADGELGAAFDRIRARLEEKPVPGIGNRSVGPAELFFGTGYTLYSKAQWENLGSALAELVNGQGSVILQLSDFYLQRDEKGYANEFEALYAVYCVDRPFPKDNASYQRLAERMAKVAPRFGPAIAWGSQLCARWPIPPQGEPHAVSGKGSPPIVVIGTTRDPATPYEDAVALAKQLDNGVLVTFDGDGHTAYRKSAPACIEDPVTAYLLTGRSPGDRRC